VELLNIANVMVAIAVIASILLVIAKRVIEARRITRNEQPKVVKHYIRQGPRSAWDIEQPFRLTGADGIVSIPGQPVRDDTNRCNNAPYFRIVGVRLGFQRTTTLLLCCRRTSFTALSPSSVLPEAPLSWPAFSLAFHQKM
jgi:hypothetical protein